MSDLPRDNLLHEAEGRKGQMGPDRRSVSSERRKVLLTWGFR